MSREQASKVILRPVSRATHSWIRPRDSVSGLPPATVPARDALVRGTLTMTDFFDEQVQMEEVVLLVAPGQSVVKPLEGLVQGRTGFFRVVWSPAEKAAVPQSQRCMVIEPYADNDSVFGMNHAFGWPFLLQLAKRSGLPGGATGR